MELMAVHIAKPCQDFDRRKKAEKRERWRFFWQVAGMVGGLIMGTALVSAAPLTLTFHLFGVLK